MMVSRRHLLTVGGGGIATLAFAGLIPRAAGADDVVEITMAGTKRGEHVWFSPIGLAVAPGTTIRFANDDRGNSHTSTAYHPDNHGKTLRIPSGAEPWDSGYLLPGKSFEITLTAPGVYDYYCVPHEVAGMVGRILVGTPDDPGWEDAVPEDGLPKRAGGVLPSVEDILAETRIEAQP